MTPSSTDTVREAHTPGKAFDSLRTALERAQGQPADARLPQGEPEKPSDTAVAMRLAGEAIATAAKSAEGELRRLRELLNQSEARVRAAEERARTAERQRGELEQLLSDIRDQIAGKYPHQRAAWSRPRQAHVTYAIGVKYGPHSGGTARRSSFLYETGKTGGLG
jgi:chromosome segregation ATPase